MCGICGAVSKVPIHDNASVRKMQEILLHRGPDSSGEFQAKGISLAVRRLSIIDLKTGNQPLFNEDRSLVLIANGEIYNFIELRTGLLSRGHRFQTESDCETILHLYEESGADCVRHLRGMFAFALWDQEKRRLLLARDRCGEKPLYLYEKDGMLIFASEIKALLSAGNVPFALEPHAIDQYFHYGYVPEPLTPLRGIRKLPPANLLLVDVESWTFTEKCYWRMEEAEPLYGNPAEILRSELETISKIIVRSDVPVGVALSGGVDSAAVTSLVARHYPDQLHAFSVGYPGAPPYDERHDAKMVADHLGIPFHDVEITTEDVARFFPDLIYSTDDPIADIAGAGYYSVAKLAREHHVPVLLQGHGGDELFWGYPWVVQAVQASRQKQILAKGTWPQILRAYMDLRLPDTWSVWGIKSWITSFAGLRRSWRLLQSHKSAPADRMVFYDLTPDFKTALQDTRHAYTSEFIDRLGNSSPYDFFTFSRPWQSIDVAVTRLINQTYLLENGLAQVDRLSMASSVESRLPLVDYCLIEKVIGLRKSQSDVDLPPKAWFKEALRGIVPNWVLQKPKRGFHPPVHEWHHAIFAAHGFQIRDGFLVQTGVLTPESALDLAEGNFPKGSIVPFSFKALVLELWCRIFSSTSVGSPYETAGSYS